MKQRRPSATPVTEVKAVEGKVEKSRPIPLSDAALKQVAGGLATMRPNTDLPVKGW